MIRHPCIYRESFGELYLEYLSKDTYCIHCYINKWDRSTYKRCLDIWRAVLYHMKGKVLYAAVPPTDTRLIKFASKFGFVYTKDSVYTDDGRFRRLMKCVS